MSFNIAGSFSTPYYPHSWDVKRCGLNVMVIKHHASDIIGFQELQPGNLKTYKIELNKYDYVLGPKTAEYPYLYNAIFWKASKIEVLNSGGFWLSRTPGKYSGDWDTALVRGATWAKMRIASCDTVFLYLATHFDYKSQWARVESTRLILEEIAGLQNEGLPVIISGDFNSNPWMNAYEAKLDKIPYETFLKNGFRDTFIEAGYQDSEISNTFHGYEGKYYSARRYLMAWRIDWILVRDGKKRIETISSEIIRDADPPHFPSDHYPIKATIRFI